MEICSIVRYTFRMRKLPLLLLLTLTAVPPAPLSSAPEPAETLSIQNLSVPKSLGRIDDRFQGTSTRWVIQIQDVHTHLPAQENIAALIDHLNAVYGIERVGAEGGWSKTSFKESWGLPSSREKQMLARGLLEEAHITGTAYAGLFTQTPLKITGLEDKSLYFENRSQYLKHLSERSATQKKLEAVEKRLSQEKASLYNTKLKKLDDALLKFEEGKKAEKFFPFLLSELQAQDVSVQDLPQMLLFKEVFAKESALDKKKLEAESARLMESYKRKRLTFEELLKSGLIPAEQMTRYPASSAYLELLRLQDTLLYRDFFSEMNTAVDRLKEKLFSADAERMLDARWYRFKTAQSLLSFEATPAVLDKFKEAEAEIRQDLAEADLSGDLDLAMNFYDLVTRRDKAFFETLMQDSELSYGDAIVVTGGFHTEGLSRHLREAGISYIVITPELGDTPPSQDLYYKRLSDSIADTQTLSESANRWFTPDFDKAFVNASLGLRTDRNIFAAVGMVVESFKAAPTAVRPETSSGSVSWNELKAWSREQQLTWAQTLLTRTLDNKGVRFYLLVHQRVLDELLQDPAAQKIWERTRGDRNNSVVAVLDDLASVSESLLGGRFKVERIQGASVRDASASTKLSRLGAALDQGFFAVILPEGETAPDARLVALKKHPVSLLFQLFLSNPELQALAGEDAFLDLLKSLLEDISSDFLLEKSA